MRYSADCPQLEGWKKKFNFFFRSLGYKIDEKIFEHLRMACDTVLKRTETCEQKVVTDNKPFHKKVTKVEEKSFNLIWELLKSVDSVLS